LRRPQIHRRFGLYNRVGLSDLFLLMRPLDSLPQGVIQYSQAAKLAVITSGKLPPNPAELLTSQKMSQFLDMLSKEYDIILIDTPPVLTVTDAAALVPYVDGVLLVTMPGKTRLRDFQQAVEQLQTVGARVLGVVLNEVDQRNRKYGYYYNRYYSKYSYYYGEDGRKKGLPAAIGKKASIS
jgi:capsular exopolysaccharide synthesis family protein